MSDLAHKHHYLLFGVRRSIRYHYRRVSFLDGIAKTANACTAIAGSATIASVLSTLDHQLAIVFASSTAILSAINLVFTPSQSARRHNDLLKSFFALEKSILALPSDSISKDQYNLLNAKRLDIEAEEPPPLRILDCMCHNELIRSMGLDRRHEVDIKWYQRLASPVIDICDHNICSKPI